MALSKPRLQASIVKEMERLGANANNQYSWLNRFAEAMAIAIVDEIQANAEVEVAGDDSDSSGPGGGSSTGGGIK